MKINTVHIFWMAAWMLNMLGCQILASDFVEPWQYWAKRPVETPLIVESHVKAGLNSTVTINVAGSSYSITGAGEDVTVTNLFIPQLSPNEQYILATAGTSLKEVTLTFSSYASRHLTTKRGSGSVVAPYMIFVNNAHTNIFNATYDSLSNTATNVAIEVRPDRGFRPAQYMPAEEQWNRDEDQITDYAPGDGFAVEIGPGRGTNTSDGAFRWAVNLGRLWNSRACGMIRVNEKNISSNLFTAASLSFTARSTNTSELQVITNSNGTLRQIHAPQTLVDILTNNQPNEQCILKFYLLSQTGAMTNGIYSITNDDPFVVWRIKNPNSSGVYNRVQFIEERSADNRTNISDIQFISASNLWQLTRGASPEQVIETRYVSITNTVRQETVQISANGIVAYKAVETYNKYPWGWELTNVVSNPGTNGLTNSFVFYTDSKQPLTYGKLKDHWLPGGQWERTYYALDGDCPDWPFENFSNEALGKYSEIRIRPWKDGPSNPDAATQDNTVHTYQNSSGNHTFGHTSDSTLEFFGNPNSDFLMTSNMTYMRFESEGLMGVNAAGIPLYSDCISEGNHEGIEYTTHRYQVPGHYLDGQPNQIDYEDNRKDAYEYYLGIFNSLTREFTTNTTYGSDFMTLITHGTGVDVYGTARDYRSPQEMSVGVPSIIPGKSTQEMAVYRNGNMVFKKMFALESFDENTFAPIFLPYELQVLTYDSLGHLTNVTWIDAANSNITRPIYEANWVGANGKDCELKMWEMNEFGEKVVYAYDSLKRLTNCIHLGVAGRSGYAAQSDIATNIIYDAAEHIVLKSVSAGGLFQSQMTDYDKSGRIIKSSGMDGVATNISYLSDAMTVIETCPGGLTVVRSNYLDGRPKSLTGTAVVSEYYDYAITDNVQSDWYNHEFNYDYPKNITRTYYATNSGPRWVEKTFNTYRLLSCVRYPGYGSFLETTNVDQNYIHTGSRIACVYTPTNIEPGVIISQNVVHSYDGYGNEYCISLMPNRSNWHDTVFEHINGCWYSTYYEWHQDNYVGLTTNMISRQRLSGFSDTNMLSETTQYDVYGVSNLITASQSRSVKTVTTITNSARSTLKCTNVTINGLVQTINSGSISMPTKFTYDAFGRLTCEQDPLGYTQGTSYDTLTGWVISRTNKSGEVTTYQYYATNVANAGELLCQIDPTAKKTYYGYSNRGELLHIWGDVPCPEECVYDGYGDLTELRTYQVNSNWSADSWPGTGATYQSTKWGYHPATGLLLSKTDALGRSVTNDYLFTRTLRTRTNARGIVTTYTFDSFGYGDVIKRSYSDGTPEVTLSDFDPMGLPYTITDVLGTRHILYDAAGCMTNVYWDDGSTLAMVDVGQRIDSVYGPDMQVLANVFSNSTPWSVELDWRYDPTTGRMNMVSNDVNAILYSYVNNSDLLATSTSKSGGTKRLTTSRSWDYGYRLRSIGNMVGTASISAHAYAYDDLDRRTRVIQADGSYWMYDYNGRNEVVSANRYWSDFSRVPGQQYGYQYDCIGNRITFALGGDANGTGLWTNSYTANALNEYSQISTPGLKAISGAALATNAVQVNNNTASRKGEFYEWPLSVGNANTALWQMVTNTSGSGSTIGGFAFPKCQTSPSYDLDGNLTFDGVWQYQWDAENRLKMIAMTNLVNVPNAQRVKLDFQYDYLGRRIMKSVSTWNGTQFANSVNTWFVYDGWNLIAELDSNLNLLKSYSWGPDLSGTMDGAGGIGGLVLITDYASGTSYFPAYDGNGNVTALVNAADQTISAQYEYSPFGELIRATGPMAKANPFRFSTKYWDEETGLVCYPSRYYNPALGRWLGRDPIEEQGGNNLYAFVGNNPANEFDPLGESSGTLTDEEGAISGGEIMEGGEGASQALSIYSRIKEAVNTYSEIQDFISNASDIIDMLDGGSGELLAQLMSLGNSSFSQGLKKDRTTYLYDKIGGNGEHLKYGVTYDLNKRYSARELGTGRLKVLAQGKRKAMLALERALHSTLPLGSEEKQKAYWLIQKAKGYSNK